MANATNLAERKAFAIAAINALTPKQEQSLKTYWSHVPDAGVDECWVWQGNVWNRRGRFTWVDRCLSVHRMAYELSYGQIPIGMTINHLCMVPLCVNPRHLEAVTNVENVRRWQVALKEGRVPDRPAQALIANAKLTIEQVQAIRADRRFGHIVAVDYGISQYAVHDIRRGRCWAWLKSDEPQYISPRRRNHAQ